MEELDGDVAIERRIMGQVDDAHAAAAQPAADDKALELDARKEQRVAPGIAQERCGGDEPAAKSPVAFMGHGQVY